MDKQIQYSAIPVGQTFRYKEALYIKSSCDRALCYYDNKKSFIRIKKHEVVTWINAWPNQLEG